MQDNREYSILSSRRIPEFLGHFLVKRKQCRKNFGLMRKIMQSRSQLTLECCIIGFEPGRSFGPWAMRAHGGRRQSFGLQTMPRPFGGASARGVRLGLRERGWGRSGSWLADPWAVNRPSGSAWALVGYGWMGDRPVSGGHRWLCRRWNVPCGSSAGCSRRPHETLR